MRRCRTARWLLLASSLSSCWSAAAGLGASEEHLDAVSLLQQGQVAESLSLKESAAPPKAKAVLRNAYVVSIEPDHFDNARERLKSQDIVARPAWGFNGSNASELTEAMALLNRYRMTEKLHPTVNNWLACMHTSPGSPPNIKAALAELAHSAVRWSPQNVTELLANDHHGCVPKVVGIAAAHVRLWERIAAGETPEGADSAGAEDPWYLVMEDDATLCPNWRKRMEEELPQAPADADVLKLFFFGHWREEDKVKGPDGSDTPFLEVRDPLKGRDLASAALYEVWQNFTWKTVPIAGFYAGTQAYLIKREGARKLLKAIRESPFQDIDMTMMLSVKHYAWRRVLTTTAKRGGGGGDDGALSLLQTQTVPFCNLEPQREWWW